MHTAIISLMGCIFTRLWLVKIPYAHSCNNSWYCMLTRSCNMVYIQTGKCTRKSLQTSTQQHQLQLNTQLMYYYSPNQTNLEWKLNNTFFTHLWQSKFHSLAVDDHLLGRVSHLLLYEPQQVLLVHTRGGVNVSVYLQGGSEETSAILALTCVPSERAPTPAGTSDSMFTMWKKICTHMKCEAKHNRDMGMGHYNDLMARAFMV